MKVVLSVDGKRVETEIHHNTPMLEVLIEQEVGVISVAVRVGDDIASLDNTLMGVNIDTNWHIDPPQLYRSSDERKSP